MGYFLICLAQIENSIAQRTQNNYQMDFPRKKIMLVIYILNFLINCLGSLFDILIC